MNYGWYGDQDVMAAVTHLQTRDDVRPGRFAVLGESMGGVNRLTELFMGLLTTAPAPPALARSETATAPRPILLIVAGGVPDEVSAGRHQQATAAAASPPGNVAL